MPPGHETRPGMGGMPQFSNTPPYHQIPQPYPQPMPPWMGMDQGSASAWEPTSWGAKLPKELTELKQSVESLQKEVADLKETIKALETQIQLLSRTILLSEKMKENGN